MHVHEYLLNRVKKGDVLHEIHGRSAIVVIANHPGEKNVVLEDKCLGLLRVPLWPNHLGTGTGVAIGIQFVRKQNDVIHQVRQSDRLELGKRVREIRPMVLEARSQRSQSRMLQSVHTAPKKGRSLARLWTAKWVSDPQLLCTKLETN